MTLVTFLKYNPGVDFPLHCPCGTQNMVNVDALEKQTISRLISVEGYTCGKCHQWIPVWFFDRGLMEKLEKLKEMSPTHSSFRYTFGKILKRAFDLQTRGREALNAG